MDGNGRWAQMRGLPRLEGHRRGADAIRRTLKAAPVLGVDNLTVYAFSSDNWKRPGDEVIGLMRLFAHYLQTEVTECIDQGIRLSVIGRRDRLNPELQSLITEGERRTRECRKLHFRIAVDYSSRDALLTAAKTCRSFTREQFAASLPAPDVDLLIRTGGEQRLSDFLLWECAYAEFVFLERMWPDFDAADLETAISSFRLRNRRFGAVPAA